MAKRSKKAMKKRGRPLMAENDHPKWTIPVTYLDVDGRARVKAAAALAQESIGDFVAKAACERADEYL